MFDKTKKNPKYWSNISTLTFSKAVDKGVKQKQFRGVCRGTKHVCALSMVFPFVKIDRRVFEKKVTKFSKASQKSKVKTLSHTLS